MQSSAYRYFGKAFFGGLIAILAVTGGNAKNIPQKKHIQSTETVGLKSVVFPGTNRAVIVGNGIFQPAANPGGDALLSAIVAWLSANFDLPAIYDHPGVELVPPLKLAALRYKGLLGDRGREFSSEGLGPQINQPDLLAIYNDTTKTIFLSETWTGTTLADLSILVHEMVHHLQHVARLKYECPAAREKLAYQAQEQWLKAYGLDLEKEFEVDMFTVLVRSACMG